MRSPALADHVAGWADPSVPWLEAWTALPVLAEATRTIRLMSIVTQMPLRNPVMLARQLLTLDQVSGDRVEQIGQLMSGEVTSYRGRHYAATGAVLPSPVQTPRPPLLIAAMGQRMLRIVARHADIWNSLSFLPDFPDQLAETRERCRGMETACGEIGRDPATLRRSYTMFDARARAKGGEIRSYESADLLVEQVTGLVALGTSDVGLYYPLDPAQVPAFERIVVDVLSPLRAAHPSI